eukprot:TRINITY_DN5416_c0_g1_i1.p1 TRINITY_DN5416_c0_g1~~TRINITY_DN5416_c0_g1_i1.p1  ORF type:complete len:295 (-),score=37.88 TRINITY_DN5416_c0_g1_i1:141-1025(-)
MAMGQQNLGWFWDCRDVPFIDSRYFPAFDLPLQHEVSEAWLEWSEIPETEFCSMVLTVEETLPRSKSSCMESDNLWLEDALVDATRREEELLHELVEMDEKVRVMARTMNQLEERLKKVEDERGMLLIDIEEIISYAKGEVCIRLGVPTPNTVKSKLPCVLQQAIQWNLQNEGLKRRANAGEDALLQLQLWLQEADHQLRLVSQVLSKCGGSTKKSEFAVAPCSKLLAPITKNAELIWVADMLLEMADAMKQCAEATSCTLCSLQGRERQKSRTSSSDIPIAHPATNTEIYCAG